MKTVNRIVGGIAIVALLAMGGIWIGFSGERVEAAIEVGGQMPEFELPDTEGKTHKLSDYKGKIVVVQFCSQYCPFSKAGDKTFTEIHNKYKNRDVVVIGIDSHKATPAADIAAYNQQNKIPFVVLKDEGNKYADVIGANVTPEVVVVDKEGKVAYHGALDNRKSPEGDADAHYTIDAVQALVDGKPVETSETEAWGCGIKRAN